MACNTNCACTPDQVDLAFRESEPYIDREIKDRSYKMRRYLVDYAPVKTFPDGVGYTLSKVRFFGDIGPQYDGFDGWRKEQRSRPYASGHSDAHDECGYVWEEVGHGFEELHFHLMNRDLKTIPICIKDIRTFWEFKQFQNLIFQNLAEISANMKEQLVRNALIGFAVKNVVTSLGLEISSANPYELPNINGVTVGRLNFKILKRIYGPLKREAGAWGLETAEGRPMFGLMASEDVLDDMFYEDPEVRQDMRWDASSASDLIKRMNFQDTVRGMYLCIPDDFAPRYRDDGAGNLIRVFPYERSVTIQSGTRPAPNPDYENAEYELVLIVTRDVFGLRTRNSLSSAGGQTDFEAETGMFEWRWHNPPRYCDPNRRVGYYFANGNIGIEPGDFTDIQGILVRRRPATLDPAFWPAAVCPEEEVSCDNQLEVQGCPCQQIVACFPVVDDPQSLFFRLSRALPAGTVVTDPVTVDLANGGRATGTIDVISTDLTEIQVDFGADVACDPSLYVQVSCNAPTECSQPVVQHFCTDSTHAILKLRDLLVVTTASSQSLSAITSLGNVYTATLTAVDLDQITYTVTLGTALADGECVVKLCVPTAVNADCPSCDPDPVVCDDDTGLP